MSRRALTHAEQVRLAADLAAILRPLWRTDAAADEAARNAAFALSDGECDRPAAVIFGIVESDIRAAHRDFDTSFRATATAVVSVAAARYYQIADQEPA